MRFLIGLFNTIFSIVFSEETEEEINGLKDPRTLPVMRQCMFCSEFIVNEKECNYCNEIKIWV